MAAWFEDGRGRIGKLARREQVDGRLVELLQVRPADPGLLARLDGSWRPLELPAELPSPGVRQCVRCRRLGWGPCISHTCTDLQAPPAWLAPLLGPQCC